MKVQFSSDQLFQQSSREEEGITCSERRSLHVKL